ncbi:MAG: hypothetical protein EOP51_00990 [Sphingobacteriales bacterium]|nr:MAG: hypothetical protein EOP51_00990 [Sphingobacteriales bacterium]
MKKIFLLLQFVLVAIAANAQSVTVPTINAPKYLNIDSSITTTGLMNGGLMANAKDYSLKAGDSTLPAEKVFTYATPTGQQLKVVYSIKTNRYGTIVNRISIRGKVDELLKIYNAFFHADRSLDIVKNTYQLDYFDYNGRKFYARFDPDTENNSGTDNWSIIIGKY